MENAAVLETIRKFLVDEVLEGVNANVTADTPLLEWGVLSSMSTMRLVGFLSERFGIEVPSDEVVGRNFKDLASITAMVQRMRAQQQDGAKVPAGKAGPA
jgi:acyl carrier protein